MSPNDENYVPSEEQLKLWDDTDESITINDVDASVKRMATLKDNYENLKALSDNAHSEYEQARTRVIDLMDRMHKTEYHVPSIGKVIRFDKMQVSMPKLPERKDALFAHIERVLGKEGFLHYATINHNSLNSMYNEMYEESQDKALFSLPGVDAPTSIKALRFNVAKGV